MTAQLPPDTPWDETKADKEWAEHRKDKTVFASSDELARLRELRNECLNEVPIKMNQLAEELRSHIAMPAEAHDLANDLQQYGLRLKRLAEEAR